MTERPYLLAIDQGTTSTRAMLFDREGRLWGQAQRQLPQIYPAAGWVEHDPEEIWQATLDVVRKVADADEVAAIGITNQRETVVVWERATGKPLHNAIVWQDRRTAELCNVMLVAGHAELVRAKTGLVIDPYFSASKLSWLLEHVPDLRQRAERGEVLAGTIDSFLLWRLTGGAVHRTDATNASRTMLFNIHTQAWDDDLLSVWNVPPVMLPEVRDSSGYFGETTPELLGRTIPITGVAGDQHAATIGQACFAPGMVKSTYGTGAFLLLNTGPTALASRHRLLTTIAYRLNGETTYALEGSIFAAGSTIQWLRDELGILPTAAASEELARHASESGVYIVPAFTGLGAPYWDSAARAAIFGITRDTGPAQLARAALEAVAFQTRDLLEAMRADGSTITDLRVDGGMAVNDWLLQALADQLDLTVRRPVVTETTAFGASCLAGLGLGWFTGLDDIATRWHEERRFEPHMPASTRDRRYAGWLDAVRRVRT